MFCDDPLVGALRRLGYNVVRYPNLSYQPLLLLEADGRRSVRSVGPLVSELPATGTPPPVRTGDPAPDIGLESTRKFSGKLALNVLQPLLSAIGMDAAVSAALTRTSSAAVSLRGVTRDSVTVGDLARYLEGDAQAASRHVVEAAKRGDLYVVLSVLRSATLSIRVDVAVAREAQAAISPATALKVSVGPSDATDQSCELSFVGTVPLAFAFQAVKLLYEGGVYLDFATARGLSGYELQGPDETLPEGTLLLDDGLVEFDPPRTADERPS